MVRPTRNAILTLIAAFALLVECQICLAAAPVFQAGAAVADITPQTWPVDMVGTFGGRQATHAWDPLSARALVLDDGQTKIAIVIVDSCYCPRSLFDEAKQRVKEATGIETDHLLMAATHTHTAPRRGTGATSPPTRPTSSRSFAELCRLCIRRQVTWLRLKSVLAGRWHPKRCSIAAGS